MFRALDGLSELPEMRFKFFQPGKYSNPGRQVGTQNKDLGAVLQTDLTRTVWFPLWRKLEIAFKLYGTKIM